MRSVLTVERLQGDLILLSILIGIAGIVLTILLVVGVHEFGHFITARLVGVKVLRFSIGFGKALYRRTDKQGTEYVLAAIPLGGYVKMLDEDEAPVSPKDQHRAYNRQPLYKKFLIVIAGPFTNLVFAFAIYWLLFVIGFVTVAPIIGKVIPQSIAANAGLAPQQEITQIDHTPVNSWMSAAIRILFHAGDKDQMHLQTNSLQNHEQKNYSLDLSHWQLDSLKPDPLTSLGIIPYEPTVPAIIGTIAENSPAARSNLKPGDTILKMGNTPINQWQDILIAVEKNPNATLPFIIKRNEKTQTLAVQIGEQPNASGNKQGYLGIASNFEWPKNLLRENKYNPISALFPAWQNTYDFTLLNLVVFGKLITGKVSVKSLGGPITIFQSAGTALNHGIIPFLSFLAFLSIAIGMINILPIPGLDGGHVLFQAIELVTRRPVSLRVQSLMYRLGILFLFVMLFQAVMNDVMRL